MSEVTNPSKGSSKALQPKNYIVPVKFNDMSIFDGAFTFMKERFSEEMSRIEDEMSLLSKNLFRLYSDAKTYQAGLTSDSQHPSLWESIANSPLVEGEGKDKTLRLQFDLSQFEPEEVVVTIVGNMLVVTANHEEKSDASIIQNQYHREFLLPAGVDPTSVVSALSKDGVLTVKAPLNFSGTVRDDSL